MTDSMIFARIKDLIPEVGDSRPADPSTKKRVRYMTFPELAVARKSFEKSMGAEGQMAWTPE